MKTEGIFLYDLHRFQLFKFCFFGKFIIALIVITLQMSRIGNIPHIPHLISNMKQIPVNQVERDKGPAISQMHITVDRWSANIHPYKRGVDWFEKFFGTS